MGNKSNPPEAESSVPPGQSGTSQPSSACRKPAFQWPQPPPFQTVSYIPSGMTADIRNRPVNHVLAVSHARLKTGGNHWCFYLQVGKNKSVQIDPTPTGPPGPTGGIKACIVFSDLNCSVSREATYSVNLTVSSGLVVSSFVNAIVSAGHDKYEFTANGTGCRKWVVDQIDLFEKRGYIKGTGIRKSKAAIRTEFEDKGKKIGTYGLVHGNYYK
jgi:hypothetical protein